MDLRNAENVFNCFRNDDFKEKYRLSKRKAIILLDFIYRKLMPKRNKTSNVTPELQLLIALRYFATGSFQGVCGELSGVSQPTVSRVIKKVTNCIAKLRRKFVYMATGRKLRLVKQGFRRIANFPEVIACVDGTHIPIKKPKENAADFWNRKGYFSLNTQLLCDHKLRITGVVCKWGGATHDSRIFENSKLSEKGDNGELDGIIIGDSGYPCKPYLLTPLLHPQQGPEQNYNASHISTRNCIERCIGLLKSKFRCLSRDSKMRLKKETTASVVVACCVLHNISLLSLRQMRRQLSQENQPHQIQHNRNAVSGLRFRAQFIQTHFQ